MKTFMVPQMTHQVSRIIIPDEPVQPKKQTFQLRPMTKPKPKPNKFNSKATTAVMLPNGNLSHCYHGHPLTDDNVYILKKGGRRCKTCQIEHTRRYVRRSK